MTKNNKYACLGLLLVGLSTLGIGAYKYGVIQGVKSYDYIKNQTIEDNEWIHFYNAEDLGILYKMMHHIVKTCTSKDRMTACYEHNCVTVKINCSKTKALNALSLN